MKKSFWKKLLAFLMLGVGVCTMSACQTTNKGDARIIDKDCAVTIYTKQGTGERYATVTLAVENNTIFDVTQWDVNFQIHKAGGVTLTDHNIIDMFVGHGARGYIVFSVSDVPTDVLGYTIIQSNHLTFRNVWQTYLGWWIAGIIIVGISLLFYGIEIFRKGITASDALEMFRRNTASNIFCFLFAFIICIIPVFFGAWVPTIILLVTLLTAIAGAALFTGIKTLTLKK